MLRSSEARARSSVVVSSRSVRRGGMKSGQFWVRRFDCSILAVCISSFLF